MTNIIWLRKMESPYLHDMLRSILVYDAEEVKQELRSEIGGKLLTQWKLVRAYQEILGRGKETNPKADAIWLLAKPDRSELKYRKIIHEVKTGKWNFEEVIEKYKGAKYLSRHTGYSNAITVNLPLFIWSWKKYYPRRDEIEGSFAHSIADFFYPSCDERKPSKGSYKIIPLDILLPILKKRLEEVFEW